MVQKSRGFTLIELMVVISIISVLVAILLPTLTSAREAARAMQCLAKVRQLGFVWHLYADDYRDIALPKSNQTARFHIEPTGAANNTTLRYWPYLAKDQLGLPDMPGNDRFGLSLPASYYTRSLLDCPAMEVRARGPLGPHYGIMDFGMGGRNWSPTYQAIRSRDDIKRPSDGVVFSDVRTESNNTYGGGNHAVANNDPVVGHRRHNDRVNYGYADGHAETGAYGTDTEPSANFYLDYKFGGGFFRNN